MSVQLPPSEDSGHRDEDDLVQVDLPGAPEAPGAIFKRRREFIEHEDFSFSPASLVGSYCHRLENAEIVWEGVVLGEPGPGKYLIELTSSLPGQGRIATQVLFDVERMIAKDEGYEFRFYDSEEAMRAAYAEYLGAAERETR